MIIVICALRLVVSLFRVGCPRARTARCGVAPRGARGWTMQFRITPVTKKQNVVIVATATESRETASANQGIRVWRASDGIAPMTAASMGDAFQ